MVKERGGGNIFEKTADKFDLPGEVVANMPYISVTGCRHVYIENHRGILEYGTEEIIVNGGRVIIKLRGSGLQLRAMNEDELLITGTVSEMNFEM